MSGLRCRGRRGRGSGWCVWRRDAGGGSGGRPAYLNLVPISPDLLLTG